MGGHSVWQLVKAIADQLDQVCFWQVLMKKVCKRAWNILCSNSGRIIDLTSQQAA